MAEREENLADLHKQSSQVSVAAPPPPKLSQLTKGLVRPEVQAAFELYDRQWEEWSKKRQVSGS